MLLWLLRCCPVLTPQFPWLPLSVLMPLLPLAVWQVGVLDGMLFTPLLSTLFPACSRVPLECCNIIGFCVSPCVYRTPAMSSVTGEAPSKSGCEAGKSPNAFRGYVSGLGFLFVFCSCFFQKQQSSREGYNSDKMHCGQHFLPVLTRGKKLMQSLRSLQLSGPQS